MEVRKVPPRGIPKDGENCSDKELEKGEEASEVVQAKYSLCIFSLREFTIQEQNQAHMISTGNFSYYLLIP